MTARAMWKGAIHFGGMRVPVKFYTAVADKGVHFRLLHEKDQVPVKQAMVNPETDSVVAQPEAQYAYVTEDHDRVLPCSGDSILISWTADGYRHRHGDYLPH